ncbi:hypothetical protein J3F83DRAFT_722715 [Trichoderma novae-zelandiae]
MHHIKHSNLSFPLLLFIPCLLVRMPLFVLAVRSSTSARLLLPKSFRSLPTPPLPHLTPRLSPSQPTTLLTHTDVHTHVPWQSAIPVHPETWIQIFFQLRFSTPLVLPNPHPSSTRPEQWGPRRWRA